MQKALSLARQAVDDYKMIDDGDKIAIGISGGKDSMFLAEVLNGLKSFYPNKFTIAALTISIGFDNMDFSGIKEYFKDKHIDYHIIKTQIKDIVFENINCKSPCSLCSRLRRGALIDAVKNLGCTKIALGHHRDDVNETFFMSMLYEGRINCFSPVTNYENRDITLIRPLIYTPEYYIKEYVKKNGIPLAKSTCPVDKSTKRQEMKDLISYISKLNPSARKNIFGAVSRSGIYGWKINSKE